MSLHSWEAPLAANSDIALQALRPLGSWRPRPTNFACGPWDALFAGDTHHIHPRWPNEARIPRGSLMSAFSGSAGTALISCQAWDTFTSKMAYHSHLSTLASKPHGTCRACTAHHTGIPVVAFRALFPYVSHAAVDSRWPWLAHRSNRTLRPRRAEKGLDLVLDFPCALRLELEVLDGVACVFERDCHEFLPVPRLDIKVTELRIERAHPFEDLLQPPGHHRRCRYMPHPRVWQRDELRVRFLGQHHAAPAPFHREKRTGGAQQHHAQQHSQFGWATHTD
mmetsp:Transcript_97211/g.156808  ORF Transcript_97211/g.156808 Transcript_97211/m.156808 type:complete len:280 (-) Transcript_97211:92-931(-)